MSGFFEGISFRLAKVGIVLALLVGMTMSAVQLYLDYRHMASEAGEQITLLVDVAAPPAQRAIYTLDYELAHEVVAGLMRYSFILEVTLKDELGAEVASQRRELSPSGTRWVTKLIGEEFVRYGARLDIPGDSDAHGYLEIVVDNDQAFSSLYNHSMLLMSTGLIRSSILVFGLFIAFHFMLTKPLIRINKEINEIDLNRPGEQRLNSPKSRRSDEFDQLIQSANQLLDTVDLALSKRKAVEVVLRKSEEHVRQIIDSLPVWVGARNSDGHYIFANKALADFLGTTPEAMRGSHISDFKHFCLTGVEMPTSIDMEVIRSNSGSKTIEEKWRSTSGDEIDMHTYIMPMEFYDEMVALVVSSDISELKSTQAQMEYMAYHDALTKLPSRSYLIEHLQTEIDQSEKTKEFGALLFIDLDQFKNINDSLGHPAGDAILKSVAKSLSEGIRECDWVCRLGGDEFVVVLTALGKDRAVAMSRAEAHAELLRGELVQGRHFYQDIELHVTGSIGIVMFPDAGIGPHELLRFADTAMYKVKEAGRDAVEIYSQGMADNATHVIMMEHALRKAFENKDFSLHFQPRVDNLNKKIVGAEALLRWEHEEKGMVSPAEFIPIMETSGLIVEVGVWVLEKSLQQVKEWQQQGLWDDSMRLSVNISPRQFRSGSFVEDISRVANDINFPPSMLEMEITEGIVIDNLEVTIDTMSSLRDLGFAFALDDFGTGYSSISYLKQLPVSVLKIDKSFVRDITEDASDRILVQTISTMGNMLGLEVVAEGVETPGQLSLLDSYDCRYYQGYLCSKPLPVEQFTELLKRDSVDWVDVEEKA